MHFRFEQLTHSTREHASIYYHVHFSSLYERSESIHLPANSRQLAAFVILSQLITHTAIPDFPPCEEALDRRLVPCLDRSTADKSGPTSPVRPAVLGGPVIHTRSTGTGTELDEGFFSFSHTKKNRKKNHCIFIFFSLMGSKKPTLFLYILFKDVVMMGYGVYVFKQKKNIMKP